ncbi:hypothetical protein A6R68_19765 [Neotoma lepida]|uniref:Uncharacterized protein n=1 Tax=Neotoma lepida TaxID=56216 RepID=A0A1A6HIQ7_NEOLE|nr:hypothetical protein A6R68_19765 [Neotoma lepida]
MSPQGPPRQRQPREDGKEEARKIKETRPKVSSHLNVGIAATSITNTDTQRTINHKMAKRQKQQIHQLRIRPLPRLSKFWLTISTIIRFGHPTRRNEYEIPAIRNEQRLELKTLRLKRRKERDFWSNLAFYACPSAN